ncbi:MAG: AI-2E family transporter [Opitutales bacterium]
MAEATDRPVLNDRQRRVVGFALTFLALLGTAALLIGLVATLGRLAGYFSGVLWPLVVAGVLALILRPVVDLLERRLRIRRLVAVILLYGLFVATVAGVLLLLVPPLMDQMLALLAYAPTLWQSATGYVATHYPAWIATGQRLLDHPAVRQMVGSLSGDLQGLLAQALPSLRAAGVGALGIFSFATHLAIVPIYLFFFLLSRDVSTAGLAGHLPFLSRSLRDDLVFLADEFAAIVVSFFRGQLLIGLLMGALLALGFTLVGLKFGLFLGLALGVLNIIPYLGTIIGIAVAVPLAFFQPDGGWHLVGLVLLVKLIVQNIEGWYLTPKIMGDRTGLHPVTIIVAIFFWGTAFDGVLGMLFAIPLTAFFVTAWRLLRRKYFAAPEV